MKNLTEIANELRILKVHFEIERDKICVEHKIESNQYGYSNGGELESALRLADSQFAELTQKLQRIPGIIERRRTSEEMRIQWEAEQAANAGKTED